MEHVLGRTKLTLDDMEYYGLNLEYLKWHREYKAALAQNEGLTKQDVPLTMRLSDYYGDSKFAQKAIPLIAMKERFNSLYKDIAAVSEFQKRYLEVQGMLPTDPSSLKTIEQFQTRQLRDSADAINILQGMQRGEVSPTKGLNFLQRSVQFMITSAKYRHSRLMLTPLVGRALYMTKLAANKVSNKLIDRDIANVTHETKLFADTTEGGFTPEVKAYVRRRLIQGYASARAYQLATRGSILLTAFKQLFGASEEEKQEGAQVIMDEMANNGMMSISAGGREYQMPLPGGMASAVRQNTKYRAIAPTNVADFPAWAFKQYVYNQLSPTVQAIRMAATGTTFSGQDAWESNEEYTAWRDQYIASNASTSEERERLSFMLPRNLSRFITELMPVAWTDTFKDAGLKRERRFSDRQDIGLKPEDVAPDYFKQITNFFGGGLTDRDPDYEEWLKESVGGEYGSMKRYKLIEEERKATPKKNIVEQMAQSGMAGVVHGEEGKDYGW
jgi:hypothetical protein